MPECVNKRNEIYQYIGSTVQQMPRSFLIISFCLLTNVLSARPDTNKIFRNRKIIAGSLGGAGYVSSIVLLNELWYKDYRTNRFHFFDDHQEWLQVDKFGHAFTCYQLGDIGIHALKWSGLKREKAIWMGGLSGLAYMSIVEVMDGFSEGWGFSWADMSANSGGSLLLIAQEKIWKEQRIRIKFSYFPTDFPNWRPEVLGNNEIQRLFKDYNAQTYWMSLNIHAFLNSASRFPRWLNIALGIGATGMTGGFSNPEIKDNYGNSVRFERKRQIYLSLDANLSKIQVKSKWGKKVLSAINIIKIPFPCLGLSGNKVFFSIQ